MTDRYHTLSVVLEHDIRSDDAEKLMNAIKMLKGVIAVNGVVSGLDSMMAQERARYELGQKLMDIIRGKL